MIELLLRLFYEFFKTGLFSVGGGLATLPFLSDMSQRTGWFTLSALTDMIAIAESTPGPIGVNMATYVGYSTAGIAGAIIATLGLITPEIVVILIICSVLNKFRNNKYVDYAFYGIRICSLALIICSLIFLTKTTFVGSNAVNYKYCILAVFLFVVTRYVPKIKNLHPVVFILFSATIGIIFGF